jgi:beta-galactosidase
MDEAVEIARMNEVGVIMGTPTASVPPWLYKLHPDVLGGNERGHFDYGGRKGLSVFSPSMREAASRIVTALALHYGRNSAVVGWQISNELAFPFVNYDGYSLHAYREWLKRKYGVIDALNDAWGGNFWSNKFDSWDEIVFPNNPAEAGWNAEMRLDYRRFFSDSFLARTVCIYQLAGCDLFGRYFQGLENDGLYGMGQLQSNAG